MEGAVRPPGRHGAGRCRILSRARSQSNEDPVVLVSTRVRRLRWASRAAASRAVMGATRPGPPWERRHALPLVALDGQLPAPRVDVRPLEGERLADPEAGVAAERVTR